MKKTLDKRKALLAVVFLLMVAVQLGRFIYVFHERPGLHSDEVHSYGFANSYYDPYIYQEADDNVSLTEAATQNMNQWEPGSKFWDYLVVNEGEAFTYDSVYYNQKRDMSPPLHTMLLHTVCSLFPETFSWWYAFSFNIVIFILSQIVFYALVKAITGKSWMALAVCGYYGFSYAAVNTFTYLRAYALLTLLTLLLIYLWVRMYQKDFAGIRMEMILTILMTALGGLTHYYFYIFAGLLAALTCFYLLIRKRWKALGCYALTMFTGAELGILLYPWCIQVILDSFQPKVPTLQWPYYWNLTVCLTDVLSNLFGISWKVDYMTFAWLTVLLPSLAVILFAVWFVCRKESWMHGLLTRIRSWMKHWRENCSRVIHGWNPFLIILFGTAVGTIMIITKICHVESAGGFEERYLFYVMPVVLMELWLLLFYLAGRYLPGKKSRQIVTSLVILSFFIMGQARGTCHYMELLDDAATPLAELTENADVVVVSKFPGVMVWYSQELRDVNSFFYLTEEIGFDDYIENLNDYEPKEDRPVYLIVEEGACEQEDTIRGISDIAPIYQSEISVPEDVLLEQLKEQVEWVDDIEFVQQRKPYFDTLNIYKMKTW